MPRVNAVSFYENRTLEQICHTILAAGFDSMEVSRIPFFEKLTTPETRRAFRDWARSLDLSLYGFDAWVKFDPYHAYDETLAGFDRAIDFTADLQLGQLITCEGQRPPDKTAADCLRVLIPLFQAVADRAAARGLRVVLEPHPDTLAMDDSIAIDLVDGIARPNLGLLYDCCHYGVGQPDTYVRAVQRLGRRIHHLHFSDGDRRTYALHLPLGEGEIQLDAIIGALRAIPFRGTLTNDLYNYPMVEEGARRNAPLIREVEEKLQLPKTC